MGKLADTVFSAGIDDTLATVDVYSQTTTDAASTTSPTFATDAEIASLLGTEKPADTSGADASVDLTNDAVLADMLAEDPEWYSAYNGMEPDLQAELIAPSGTEQIEVSDPGGGILMPPAVTDASKGKNIAGLLKMVEAVACTGSSLLATNIAAKVAFLSNLINAAIKNGIPNVYAKIDCGCFHADIMAGVTKNGIGLAAKSGNLNLLMNIANGSLSGSVKGMLPGLATKFAANFKLAPGTSPKLYGQIASNISSSFTKINPSWAQNRSGTALNGNLFLNSSPDFKKVLGALVGTGSNFYRAVSQVSSIASALPSLSRLNLGVKSASVGTGDSAQSVYSWPSGRTDTYTPRTDAGYDVQTTQPVAYAPGDTDYTAAQSYPINDPMILGASLVQAQESTTTSRYSASGSSIDAQEAAIMARTNASYDAVTQQANLNYQNAENRIANDFPATSFGTTAPSYLDAVW
jgi:hypothetical protein